MSDEPTFADSWAAAEADVFAALCTATSSAEGRQAYRGRVPDGSYNTWALDTFGGDGRTLWQSVPHTMKLDATIEGRFLARQSAQQFAMAVIGALPIRDPAESNVHVFRVAQAGMPVIEPETVPVANDSRRERTLYVLRMRFEFVFRTIVDD